MPDRTSLSGLQAALQRAADHLLLESRRFQWRTDPVVWAKDRLNMDLWSMQQKIAFSVRDNKKTAVKSCHGIGKSQLAAVLACWWIDVHPINETMVVTTAPTNYQVNKILWEYIRKIHREHDLIGTVSEANEWKAGNRDVIGVGRKPADSNDNGFQGIHKKYVLVLLDESGGIPNSIWVGTEAITTADENRILAIGNPDDAATEFGRIFRDEDDDWARFTVSAFDTPNFTGEVEKYRNAKGEAYLAPLLVSKAWVESRRKKWGETSGLYRSKVLGEFPLTSRETLFPPHLLQSALGRNDNPDDDSDWLNPEEDIDGLPVRPKLGVDIARFGTDKCTIIMNANGVLTVIDSWDKTDLVTSAEKIHKWALDLQVDEVRIDGTGVGAGVVDILVTKMSTYYQVYSMIGSAASPDSDRWLNARAFWHDHFLNMLRDHRLSLPSYQGKGVDADEKIFYDELESIQYKFAKGARYGALQIESKDEMRKRTKKSPDFSDAAMYACAPVSDDDLLSRYNPGDQLLLDAEDWAFEDWADHQISAY